MNHCYLTATGQEIQVAKHLFYWYEACATQSRSFCLLTQAFWLNPFCMPLLDNQVNQNGIMNGCACANAGDLSQLTLGMWSLRTRDRKSPFLGKGLIDGAKNTTTNIPSKYYKLGLPSWENLQGMNSGQPILLTVNRRQCHVYNTLKLTDPGGSSLACIKYH